jgi:hypothetical protein
MAGAAPVNRDPARNIPNGTGFSRYTATIIVIVDIFAFSNRYTTV